MVCFPRHLQDTRKALRHRKAGNHAGITTGVGNQKASLTFTRWGLPALSESHINHMLGAKISREGRGLEFSQPFPCLKNKTQHPSSHTSVCKTRMLWGQEVVSQTSGRVQRATMEKRPWCCGVLLDTNAGVGSDLQFCVHLVSSSRWGLPYVPDLVLFVVILVLIILCHCPGVHPQLAQSVLWSQLPFILQVI